MIRVALADAHEVVREGLESILSRAEDVVIVGSFGAGESLLRALPECCPDLLFIEAQLPDGSGAEWVCAIRRECPSIKVIILASAHHEADFVLALEAGIDGYLSKEDSVDSLRESLRAVQCGRFYVGPSVAGHVLSLAMNPAPHAFTARELDVLTGLYAGLTTNEIASKLCVSASTVKTHITVIYRKLDARNRVEATREAARRGLIGPD